MGLISLASTIRTCSRKKIHLLALMYPQPCPRKQERRLAPLLLLLVGSPVHLLVYHVWFQPFSGTLLFSGKRSSLSRTESNEAFQRRGPFHTQPLGDFSSSSSSLPAKDPIADPFAPSSPPRHNVRDADRFASFDKVSSSLSSSPSPSLDSE